MRARTVFVVMLMVAGVIPALIRAAPGHPQAGSKPEPIAWPTSFEGRALTQLPLSAVEQRFAAQFPGRIGRFTDGRRNVIIRIAAEPTRLLHPAADCFRGLGYRVHAPRVVEDGAGVAWSCFVAEKDGAPRRVCERIYDASGRAWTDVSAWYWAALFGRTQGPWFALTVAAAP